MRQKRNAKVIYYVHYNSSVSMELCESYLITGVFSSCTIMILEHIQLGGKNIQESYYKLTTYPVVQTVVNK